MGVPESVGRLGAEPVLDLDAIEGLEGQQRLFLLRLRRLIWLRRSCSGQLDDSILKVLDKAIYATYCDCIEAGVIDDARKLLKQPV